MREVEKDGIVFVEDSDVVRMLQFAYDHVECSMIFKDADFCKSEAKVVAYASSEKFNGNLEELYETKYKEKGYEYIQGLSRDMESLDGLSLVDSEIHMQLFE